MELGQKVRVNAVAEKKKTRERFSNWSMTTFTRWERKEIEPREGLYIGTRTICDCDFVRSGLGHPDSYDEEIHIKEYYRVYLVVFSPRENPVYVFPEDCKVQS